MSIHAAAALAESHDLAVQYKRKVSRSHGRKQENVARPSGKNTNDINGCYFWFERHRVFYFKWLPVSFLRFPIGGFQFQYGIFRKASLVKRPRVVLNHFQAFVARNRGNLVR